MNNNKIMKLFLIIVSVIGVVEMGVIPTSHLSTYNETMETTIIQILLPNNDVLNIQLKLYLFKNSSLANINNIDELESKLKTSQEEPTMASYITEERKLKKDEDDEAPQETTTTTTTTETTTTETTTTQASSSSTTTEASSSSTTTEASSTEASSSTEATEESSSSTPPPANFQIYDEYDDLSSPSKQSFTPLNEEDGNNDNDIKIPQGNKIINKTKVEYVHLLGSNVVSVNSISNNISSFNLTDDDITQLYHQNININLNNSDESNELLLNK
ncbi:poly(A) polymerase-like isoform X2 [Drosophila takahashii]|uniref:poly(A) polymerase-like isoform X2 n=1 Tax=Drosophila takahashii TaxID=29030 RepID=UPI003899072A